MFEAAQVEATLQAISVCLFSSVFEDTKSVLFLRWRRVCPKLCTQGLQMFEREEDHRSEAAELQNEILSTLVLLLLSFPSKNFFPIVFASHLY